MLNFKVDFLGIGPSKAGTTWLGHMLEAHPEICMAEPKEVHYFNDSLSFNNSYETRHYPLGNSWYEKHFKHCSGKKIRGEITPRYIIDPIVPKRIFDHSPRVKILVCLRAPRERIISHYHSARDYHGQEPRPVSSAIRQEPEYIEACLYYKNISRFLPFFSLDQFFFMDMEQVKKEPETVLKNLYDFLGVDNSFIPEKIKSKSNPARKTRSVGFRKWVGGTHRWMIAMGLSPLIRMLKKLGVGAVLNRINSGPIEKVNLTEDDIKYINSKISEDVLQFGKLIRRDFSHWIQDPS